MFPGSVVCGHIWTKLLHMEVQNNVLKNNIYQIEDVWGMCKTIRFH